MQDGGQFFRKISRDRVADERFSGGQEGTVAGEPGRLAGPQAIGSEAGDPTKSVVTAAMGVAGQVVELFELSENGKVDIRAEGHVSGREVLVILSWSSSFRNETGENERVS